MPDRPLPASGNKDAAQPSAGSAGIASDSSADAAAPVRRSLAGLLDLFAAFPRDFMEAGRPEQEQAER
ncbi:AbrB family transcriptional regulator [Cupriavidus taiwanensis]|uniref:AbrB family transcriptional regulator n=1 Tax=Cupriavidus taiwanensis TaxID=164546 RepID=UPI001573D732|nr:AbrB family transcriptional regulator [Cupriavidus taiwanensis]MDK3022175.1 AbrB family transcriptional regulator [Cupriavidus taiwanensis]NSX13037.1 AbrB family transcriptional regulator [Cupriavidus taiwanensis]